MINAMFVETVAGRLLKLSPFLSLPLAFIFILFPSKLFAHSVLVAFQYEFFQWLVNVFPKATGSGCV
jgi:hypothetical protein